jgi:hypothetical protein
MRQQPYGIDNAIQNVGDSFNREFVRYAARPPLKKNLFRAGGGAGLITFCVYVAVEFEAAMGLTAGQLLHGSQALPAAPPEVWWVPRAAWVTVLAFGLLWFVVGVKGARGARDVMQAVWALILTGIFAALLWWGAYLPRDWVLVNFLLHGIYIAGMVGSLVRFWLSVRGLPGVKLEAVKAQQAHGRARDATETEAAAKLNENAAPRPPRQFQD